MPASPGTCDEIIRNRLTSGRPSNDKDYARGFLAGMMDTDGTYLEGKELGYCQYEGLIFEQVCAYLDLLGYDWIHDEGKREYSYKSGSRKEEKRVERSNTCWKPAPKSAGSD